MKLLLVEDSEQYQEVAIKALKGHDLLFAETYEQAQALVRTEEFDGVLADLFFPAKTDWKRKYLPQLKAYKYRCELEIEEGCFAPVEWSQRAKEASQLLIDFDALPEQPSGLGLAEWLSDEPLPLVIISQGERYVGELAVVRQALRQVREFILITHSADPLPVLLLYQGIKPVDKTSPQIWQDAVKELRARTL